MIKIHWVNIMNHIGESIFLISKQFGVKLKPAQFHQVRFVDGHILIRVIRYKRLEKITSDNPKVLRLDIKYG